MQIHRSTVLSKDGLDPCREFRDNLLDRSRMCLDMGKDVGILEFIRSGFIDVLPWLWLYIPSSRSHGGFASDAVRGEIDAGGLSALMTATPIIKHESSEEVGQSVSTSREMNTLCSGILYHMHGKKRDIFEPKVKPQG